MFDLKKYNRALNTRWLGHNINYFGELDSTNTYLKKLPAEDVTHGQICFADHQTQGRGQYERNWETKPGKNLTFTLVFRPSNPSRFHVLTLACARATVDEIEAATRHEAFIKWPNDIVINSKKAGGLLTEAVFNGNKFDRLLIGVGLNINQDRFSSGLQPKATSLKKVMGKDLERERFLGRLLSRIEYEYMRWHKHNNEQLISINQKIIGYGQWIRLQVNGHEYSGQHKLLGINQKGELTAVTKDGDLETFSYEQIRLITD